MEKFKKTVYILSAVLCLFMFYGCSGENEGNGEESSALLYLGGEKNEDEEPEDTEFIPKAKEPEFLSEEMDTRIRQDYFDAFYFKENSLGKNLIIIREYLGTYDNWIAMIIHGYNRIFVSIEHTAQIIDIDGIQFYSPPTAPIVIDVWKEGKFYALQEVYELGLLTRDDLRNIAYYHSLIEWDKTGRYNWDPITGWRSK